MTSEARIRLWVSITHEIGHDRNMVLRSELHSIKEAAEGKRLSLHMQEGIRFDFDAQFIQREQDYGPSPYVYINGKIYDYQGILLREIAEEESFLKIGQEQSIVYESDEGRRVTVVVRPEINQ